MVPATNYILTSYKYFYKQNSLTATNARVRLRRRKRQGGSKSHHLRSGVQKWWLCHMPQVSAHQEVAKAPTGEHEAQEQSEHAWAMIEILFVGHYAQGT